MKVMKPSIIIPLRQEQEPEDLESCWSNLYGVNTTMEGFKITVEEFGMQMTAFVEGTLERTTPRYYKGIVVSITQF